MIGIVFALIFIALAIVAFIAYSGTPHGGPTTTCAPIHFLGHDYTLNADCRYISIGELAIAIAFLLLALIAVLLSRPHKAP
jgi:tryptophan-rich sensory protein